MRTRLPAALAALLVAAPGPAADPIPASAALEHVGQECTVEFVVRSTGSSRKEKLIFLNSEENFRSNTNFSVVIDPSSIGKFTAAGIKNIETHFHLKKIRVTGTVEHFKSVTDIKVTKPDQIVVVDEKPDLGFVRPTAPMSTPDDFDPRPTSYTWLILIAVGVVTLGVGIFVGRRIKANEPAEVE